MTLRACPQCARHVRSSDASCPFCRTNLPALARLVALGGALAVTASCTVTVNGAGTPAASKSTNPGVIAKEGSAPPAMVRPLYGVVAPPHASPSPSPSASPEASPEPSAEPSQPDVRPLYGAVAPSPTTSATPTPTPTPDNQVRPLYGAVAPSNTQS